MAEGRHGALETSRSERQEPIAIVGIGCRFPGADSPGAFWALLARGGDAVVETPPDRWSNDLFFDPDQKRRGKTYSRWGGFLDAVDGFDAGAFKISPREAARMDPQQRLLLETTWEALEDAGLDQERLAGSETGVFVGISTHDFGDIQSRDCYEGDAYTNTGGALSIAANRLSYFFDLRGPSVAVDTACSSSLVAMHLACQSLRAGECHSAIVGGVNCLLTPEATIGFSRAQMLSPHGRCRAFDAGADGYVRAEGAGVVVLKRLSDAIAAGDTIRAVVIGTGVNQDGHSQGMTVPSAEAQEALLRDIYGRAEVQPDRLLYFEAHGTGTQVGDPLEAAAIGAALGRDRTPGRPLPIGSVKSNIGHLEAGAGMAGLIKSVLILERRAIPPTVHFSAPNPRIPFEELGLRVVAALEEVPRDATASIVGVNSFGFGGTNAHVALDRAPDAAPLQTAAADGRARLVPVSARSQNALQAAATALASMAAGAHAPALRDLAHTAGTRRTHHDVRLAVVASTHTDLAARLDAASRGEPAPGLLLGRRATSRQPRVAFVYSGMGPQWWAMGHGLFDTEPVFRAAVEECDALFRDAAGWSLVEVWRTDEPRSRMSDAEVAQPANFMLQVGLTTLLRSWGIAPDAIIGHSAGEVAAVWAAGILALEDAVTVIHHRSRLQQRATGQGRMLAAGLPAAQASALIGSHRGRISVAAINSPTSVAFSGDADALERLEAVLRESEVFTRMLDGRVPYHSHYMDPLKEELLASLAFITPRQAVVPYYSVVSGERADGRETDAAYWWANVRQPVLFTDAAGRMLDDGVDAVVELGPHPVLGRSVIDILADRKAERIPVLASMRRETAERETLLGAAAALHIAGCRLDWAGVNGAGASVDLPLYQWQRERCWAEPEASTVHRLGSARHPLLQRRLDTLHPLWEAHLDGDRLSYLRGHVVQDAVVFPGAAYLEAALAASRALTGDATAVLEDVRFRRAMVLRDEEQPTIQLAVHPDQSFTLQSKMMPGQSWTANCSGRIGRYTGGTTHFPSDQIAAIRARCSQHFSRDYCYGVLTAMGFTYGPEYQGIAEVWQGDGESLARIECPQALLDAGDDGHVVHPALLDACFQVVVFGTDIWRGTRGRADTIMPVEVDRFRHSGRALGPEVWCHLTLEKPTSTSVRGHFLIANSDGTVVIEIRGFKGQRVVNLRHAAEGDLARSLHELEWHARSLPGHRAVADVAALPDLAPDVARVFPAGGGDPHQRATHYDEVEPHFTALCGAYAWEAFRGLGWSPRDGERVDLAALPAALGVAESRRPLARLLLEFIVDDGLIARDGDRWVVGRTSGVADSAVLRRTLHERYPKYEGVLGVLDRAGATLHDLLRGADAADDAHVIGAAVAASPFRAAAVAGVRQLLAGIATRLPAGRPIRVLEIGAGAACATSAILSALPRHRTEYLCTDPTSAGLAAARAALQDAAFVEFRQVDLAASEGPHALSATDVDVDVVIALDTLTPGDAERRLRRAADALAPGGVCIAVARARPQRALDVLHHVGSPGPEGDGVRPDGWQSADAWKACLVNSGLAAPIVVSDDGPGGDSAGCVMVARSADRPAPAVEGPSAEGTWVVFGDAGGQARTLAADIAALGGTVFRVETSVAAGPAGPDRWQIRRGHPEDLDAFLSVHAALLGVARGVVHLGMLDAQEHEYGNGDDGMPPAAATTACVEVLQVLQALVRTGLPSPPRLWLVTRGAQATGVESTPCRPLEAALWGLGRVAMNEQPLLHTTLVDLDPADPGCGPLAWELATGDDQQEVAWRGATRLMPRLAAARPAVIRPEARTADSLEMAYQLQAAKPGALESLRLREVPRRAPGPGEIELRIEVAGINYRDVMKALGNYPDQLGEAFYFGDECAGVVVRVGQDVTDLKVGDEVMAMGLGCFGNYRTGPVESAIRRPTPLSREQAATLPMVFLTVHYGLGYAARLQHDERILIHSAAGGVGLAAVQYAQMLGAEIFATAGSPEKRAMLTNLGVPHVMDSRSLDFADEIRDIVGNRGLDVVLNSLAGEYLTRSLALLRPMGRFVELGKVDFFENNRLGLAPFKQGLSFLAYDLGYLLEHFPVLGRTLFSEVAEMFEQGQLRPLPVRTFPVSEAATAFRLLAQARHIGKLALTMDAPLEDVVCVDDERTPFKDDVTYLVTGGLRGFGLSIALWMTRQGARHLVLASRSGAVPPETEAALQLMRDAGATPVVRALDVADEAAVAALVREIAETMPPLGGVLHAAATFDDGFLLQLDARRLADVMAPKAYGAWNLHRHTRHLELDLFVMFSSIASVIGSPGQGNYAAANAVLDGLAHHRRALGLPALTVNWGAIGEVGYFARHPDLAPQLEKQGFSALAPQDASSLLARAIAERRTQVTAMRFDATTPGLARTSAAVARRFGPLLQGAGEDGGGRGSGQATRALVVRLAAAPPEERGGLIEGTLRVDLARLLGVRESSLDADQPLVELGIDSLMSVELEAAIKGSLGIDLPLGFLVSDNVTLRRLSQRLATQSQPAIDALTAGHGEAATTEARVEAGTAAAI